MSEETAAGGDGQFPHVLRKVIIAVVSGGLGGYMPR